MGASGNDYDILATPINPGADSMNAAPASTAAANTTNAPPVPDPSAPLPRFAY